VRRIREGVERLQQHFDESHIDVTEFDRRIALVKKAIDEVALAAVFADLPAIAAADGPREGAERSARGRATTGRDR